MIICETCAAGSEGGGAGVAELAAKLRALVGPDTEVQATDCMNVCSNPVTVAFRAEGKTAYLFAGVDPAGQVEELAAFARMYAQAEGGVIEDARPCGNLRFCLIGRIPG